MQWYIHDMQQELFSQLFSSYDNIYPSDQKIDRGARVDTDTHTAAAVQSHSKSWLHLWSHQADALDRKPDHGDPEVC